MIISG